MCHLAWSGTCLTAPPAYALVPRISIYRFQRHATSDRPRSQRLWTLYYLPVQHMPVRTCEGRDLLAGRPTVPAPIPAPQPGLASVGVRTFLHLAGYNAGVSVQFWSEVDCRRGQLAQPRTTVTPADTTAIVMRGFDSVQRSRRSCGPRRSCPCS